MEKKHPQFGEIMGTNFPGSFHKMGLLTFPVLQNIDWKTYTFPLRTIGWKFDGRKPSYFGESMDTSFPGSSRKMGFNAFSNPMGY